MTRTGHPSSRVGSATVVSLLMWHFGCHVVVLAFAPHHLATTSNRMAPIVDTIPSRTTPHWQQLISTALLATVVPDVDQGTFYNETDHSSSSSSKAPSGNQRNRSEKAPPKEDGGRQYFADDYLFNEALNKLARQAGEATQPVIRRAVACEEMWKDFCLAPEKKWQPDTVSFNIVLKAWGRAGQVLVLQHSEHATPPHLLDPDVHIFTARGCAEHASELLAQQEQKYQQEQQDDHVSSSAAPVACPDVASYNSVMEAWAKSRVAEALPEVQALMKNMLKRKLQPDCISFSALMEAHAYSKENDRLEEVQKIWSHMEAHEDPKVRPNARCLIALLRTYSRAASDAITQKDTKELLKQLERQTVDAVRMQEKRYQETQNPEDKLSVYEFTAAMDVLSKLGTRSAAHWAENMWQKMEELGVPKNTYTYVALITAWSRVTHSVPNATQRVVDLLEELWQDGFPKLNNRPFTAALRGYARSNYPVAEQPNKAILALDLIRLVREKAKDKPAMKPDLQLYNAAIDCCGKIHASPELQSALLHDGSLIQSQTSALKIAFALLQAMKADNVSPNSETFGKLLMGTTRLLPTGEERTNIAESVFFRAKDAGVADKNVLQNFQKAVDADFWNKFVVKEQLLDERGRIDWRKIPREWTKNSR